MALSQEKLEEYKSGVRIIRNIILNWSDQFLQQTDRFDESQLTEIKKWRQLLRDSTEQDMSFINELPYPVADVIPNMPDFLIPLALKNPFLDAAISDSYKATSAVGATTEI